MARSSSSVSSKRAQGIHNPALLDTCTSSNCSRPYQKEEATCESTEVQIYKSYKQLGVLFNKEADDEGEHSFGAAQLTMPNA